MSPSSAGGPRFGFVQWLWPILGGLVAWWLWNRGPLPQGDSLASTFATSAFVVGALAALNRFVAARGGRALAPGLLGGELVAFAVLTIVTLARHRLGLPGLERALFAGWVLLVGHHAFHQLGAMRPLLGKRLSSRPSIAFFLLPAVVYVAFLPWAVTQRPPDGDEPWYLLITHSLAHDLDADLTNNYRDGDWHHFLERPLEPQPGDPVGPDGELYSRHNATLPMLLAPAYRVAGLPGALVTMALLTALLGWTTLRLAGRYFPEGGDAAVWAYALVAFLPPLLLYSSQIWVEVPAALLLVLALDGIHALGPRVGLERGGWRRWAAVGLPILFLPLVKIRFMLIAAPLVGLAWWRAGRPWKPVLALGAVVGAIGLGILTFNHFTYGNSLRIHQWEQVEPQRYSLAEYAEGLTGLGFDAAFGLFAAAPLWLLVLPAFFVLSARRQPLLADLLISSLPYFLIVAPRDEWYGGWSPFFRYGLVVLPLLGLAVIPLLKRRRLPGPRLLIAGLGALSLALTLVWLVMPGLTYSFADGRSLLLDRLSLHVGGDVARFFPSYVRYRPADWIWPPVCLAVVALAWWWPWGGGARRSGEASGEVVAPRGVGGSVAGAFGVALVCLGGAAFLAAPGASPTRLVELEDPYVRKQGGHVQPQPWAINRTLYRGSWVLREGESLSIPVVSGGERLALTLEAHFSRHHPTPFVLEVWVAGRRLATRELSADGVWETVDLGEVAWPAEAGSADDLILRVPPPAFRKRTNGVALDRLELAWK